MTPSKPANELVTWGMSFAINIRRSACRQLRSPDGETVGPSARLGGDVKDVACMKYLRYEIATGQVTEVTADEILQWFVACYETQGDVWTDMNRKNFFFGSRERIYANEKSVTELGLTYFKGKPYFTRARAKGDAG
jgi:hypothetical protein